jgi:type I restriction enzyme, R subunit
MKNPLSTPYEPTATHGPHRLREQIEYGLMGRLQGLKYDYRRDITNRATLERNFREKFEALNRVTLTDSEFAEVSPPPQHVSHG